MTPRESANRSSADPARLWPLRSSPVAPHPASRRRSYLQLRSPRPAPTRTSTMQTERPHGAHSFPRKRESRRCRERWPWVPALAGMTKGWE
jgi:hypothetical protein